MRVVGLVSGGKDSCYAMMECVAAGHELVGLVNVRPPPGAGSELDSFMYQTVGHQGVEWTAEAMELPLFQGETRGKAVQTGALYAPTPGDEVEDLMAPLAEAKAATGAEAVSVGAVLSDYQRVRVESVCERLGMTALAYLWRRDQKELLREMIERGIRAVPVKVASLGLRTEMLGRPLEELLPALLTAGERYSLNVCGEGGEYETFTLDCPLFRRRIVLLETETVVRDDDPHAPVAHLELVRLGLEDKIDPPVPEEILESDGSIRISPSGHFRTGGVSGKTATETMNNLLGEGLGPDDVRSVTLYARDLADYAATDRAYAEIFHSGDPPTRACVECPLPEDSAVVLEASGHTGGASVARTTFVRSVSHWAPANVGHYSQTVEVNNSVELAGQIPLVPGTMELAKGDESVLCSLVLRHVRRVLDITGTQPQDVTQAVCYATSCAYIDEARRQWKEFASDAIVDYVIVSRLPRDAPVEFQVSAFKRSTHSKPEEFHRRIKTFEEYGRRLGSPTDVVSVAGCQVSPASNARDFSVEDMVDILTHLIDAAVDLGSDAKNESVVGVRIFYRVNSLSDVRILSKAARIVESDVFPGSVFAFVPVIRFLRDNEFLSVSVARRG